MDFNPNDNNFEKKINKEEKNLLVIRKKDTKNTHFFFFIFFIQVQPVQFKSKYRNYNQESLTNAYIAVTEENMSVLGAARQFGVPTQTLRDRVKGTIDIDTVKSGKSPVLSAEEEALIVRHLKEMASLGYGYTRTEVVDIATDYAVISGKRERNNPFTLRWYEGFMSRWPELKLVKPRALELQRAKAGNKETVSSYFTELNEILTKYDLKDKPHLIFNVDEKGVQQNHTPPSVVAGKDACAQAVTSQKSSTTTIIGCGSASGVAIPPYFVFAGARMRQELLAGKSAGADGTVSESGWSNSVIFRDYLEHHFLKHVPGRGEDPVLLILDGHKSHVSVGLTDWAREHNIILFVLPAHTSHFLQPLDVGCYGPFHKIYNSECHKQMRKAASVITRYNICEIASKVYSLALSPENLRSAFKRAGIFPLDQTVIQEEYLQPSAVFEEKQDENGETEAERCDASEENNESEKEISAEKFLSAKVDAVKKVKSEVKQKERRTMSKVTSGHCITEERVINKMRQHEETQNGNRSAEKKRKATKTQKSPAKPKRARKGKKSAIIDSQEPGPSRINLTQDSTEDSEDSVRIDDADKCCVCGLFTPKEVRDCVSLIFTSWVQCDRCPHWVHLRFCTKERVIRKGDSFYCTHCK